MFEITNNLFPGFFNIILSRHSRGDRMEKKKRSFKSGVIYGSVLMLLVVFIGSGLIKAASVKFNQSRPAVEQIGNDKEMKKKLKLLGSLIDDQYLYSDKLTKEQIEDGIYKGFAESMGDPYTVYYNAEETKDLFESTSGQFSGIGALLSLELKTGLARINKVYEDSPAEKAGLKEGDIIYQVDEHEFLSGDLSELVSWVRGEEGTKVVIKVYRGENMEKKEFTVTRGIVEAVTVSSSMLEDKIGYLAISEFDTVTYEQFKEELAELEKQDMKGLIIDLRGNPGGILDITVNMLKEILPKGMIVSTKDKNGKKEEYKNPKDHTFKKPLVVLVDENSASASEIFTGAVKDHGVGTIVGKTTYGKGIVQRIIELRDGSSLKVTISEYFTPSGECIHGKGIKPNVEVEFQFDPEKDQYDSQMQKAIAIIKGQL